MRNPSLAAVIACVAAVATQFSCSQLQPKGGSQSTAARLYGSPVRESIRASQLFEIPVTSGEGEGLGKVQDLIFNPNTGQIESALVSKSLLIGGGSVTALGEIIVPVPWQAIRVASQRQFLLNVDREKVVNRADREVNDSDAAGYAVHIFGFLHSPAGTGLGSPGGAEVETGEGSGQGQPVEPKPHRVAPNEL